MAQFKKYVKNSLAMSRNKESIQSGLNELYSEGIGFPLEYLDELTEDGVRPPVLHDLETGEVLSRIIIERDKKGKLKTVEKNEKYQKGMAIVEKMYEKLHNKPFSTLKDPSNEEVAEALMEQADDAIQAAENAGANITEAEKETFKKEYVPVDEDDEAVDIIADPSTFPPILLNQLIEEYKSEYKEGNLVEPEIDKISPEYLTKRFKAWVKDSGEKTVKSHNERVSEKPETFSVLSVEQKKALRDLGYDDSEVINEMSMPEVLSLLKEEVESVTEEEVKPMLDELVEQVEIIKEDEEDTTTDQTEVEGTVSEETQGETEQETERELAIKAIEYIAADMDYYSTPLSDKKFTKLEDAKKFVNDYFDKEESKITLSENATDLEIENAAEEILSKIEEDENVDKIIDEFEEEIETPLFSETEDEEEDVDSGYRKSAMDTIIDDATEKFKPIEGESDYYNKIMAIEQFIVNRIGEEVDEITITESLIRDIYKDLKADKSISQELVYESSQRADKIVYEYNNKEVLDIKGKSKDYKNKALRKLGYTKKDIASFSEKAKDQLLKGDGITKLEYLNSLKSIEVKELKTITELFEGIDTNVRTEEELNSIINRMALDNQELFDRYEESILSHKQNIKNNLATLSNFSNLKVGDVIRTKDGSLKKVEKITKSKVKLVNYNDIIRDQVELSKAEFNDEKALIINDFNKNDLAGLKSELEKQNVDELSNLLRTFTGGALTVSEEEDVTEEDIKELFKVCKRWKFV